MTVLSISGVQDLPDLDTVDLIISIHDPGDDCPSAVLDSPAQVHELVFHDVGDDPDEQDTAPQAWQLERLKQQLELLQPERVHVHCFYGISRSTAIASFALACRQPELSDQGIVQQVLAARPQAVPNRTLLQLADDVLERRLSAAWKKQGRY